MTQTVCHSNKVYGLVLELIFPNLPPIHFLLFLLWTTCCESSQASSIPLLQALLCWRFNPLEIFIPRISLLQFADNYYNNCYLFIKHESCLQIFTLLYFTIIISVINILFKQQILKSGLEDLNWNYNQAWKLWGSFLWPQNNDITTEQWILLEQLDRITANSVQNWTDY